MRTETKPDKLLPDRPDLSVEELLDLDPVAPPVTVENTHAQATDACLGVWGGRLVYRPKLDLWLEWTTQSWAERHAADVQRYIKRTLSRRRGRPRLVMPYRTRAVTKADHAALLAQPGVVANDEGQPCDAKTRAPIVRIPIPADEWAETEANHAAIRKMLMGELTTRKEFDAAPELLNCNGVVLKLDVDDPDEPVKVVGPLRAEHFITKSTAVDYVPTARSALWETTISQIIPDRATREFVQMALGYTLYGATRDHILVVLRGLRRNGKSLFVELFGGILGTYAMAFPSSLLEDQAGQHPTELIDLEGCRFAYVSETERKKPWNVNRLKKITGGDSIKARGMGQNFFRFPATHVLWVVTNNAPILKENDAAFGDRYREVYCPNRWYHPNDLEDNQEGAIGPADLGLKDKLLAEGSALLNWALDGWRMYVRNGGALPYPEGVARTSRETREKATTFGVFAHDHFDKVVGDAFAGDPGVPISQVFEGWKAFLQRNSMLGAESPTRDRDVFGAVEQIFPHVTHLPRTNNRPEGAPRIKGLAWNALGRELLGLTDTTATGPNVVSGPWGQPQPTPTPNPWVQSTDQTGGAS